MKLVIKNELLLIILFSLVLILITLFSNLKMVKIVLGLPFVLLFPGYTLSAALFPGTDDVGSIERLVLSFGLSIISVPMLCLGLNYTAWGISLYPVLTTIMFFILAMSALALYRRNKLPEDKRFILSFEVPVSWSKYTKAQKVLQTAILGTILLTLGMLCYVLTTPKAGEKFTEFYLLGQEGMAADYPQKLSIGEGGMVIACIVNNEQKTIKYRMEVRMGSEVIYNLSPIILEHGEKWEKPISFKARTPGENIKLEFVLFIEGDRAQKPYRKLHMWMDVKE